MFLIIYIFYHESRIRYLTYLNRYIIIKNI